MSNDLSIPKAMMAMETKFESMLDRNINSSMTFLKEASFIRQVYETNSHLMGAIRSDIRGFQDAICNIANIGLTLNPALGYAYIVPRKGKICLDVSYKGMVKLAVINGCIRHCSAEVVKEGDEFKYNGMYSIPEHSMTNIFSSDDIRSNRKTIGAYCVAKMPDGTYMTNVMDLGEINKRADMSTNKGAYSLWKKWHDEMCKKTVIRNSSKNWIASDGASLEEKIQDVMLDEYEDKKQISDSARDFLEGSSVEA